MMRPPLVHGESLQEYFAGLVDQAVQRQGLPALDLTRFYLAQLLTDYAHPEPARPAPAPKSDGPLALRLAHALEAGGSRQRAELRGLADDALFVAGFFSDSLARRLVDVDYYAALGAYAYQHLSQWESDSLAPAYAELGDRFLAFADVLTEVSEGGGFTSSGDLLRLYERWIQFGSRRHRERLLRRGIVPPPQALLARTRVQ